MEMALRQGQPIPKAILDNEDLPPGLDFYMEAFATLCDSRASPESGIPYSEKLFYCEAEGIHGEDRDDFIYLITQLDIVYVGYYRERREQADKEAAKKPKGPLIPKRQQPRR